MNKTDFLSNQENKQNFINLLSDALVKSNCRTYHSHNDAQTAIESAKNSDTVLIGDDTDLLVLLCYYTDLKSHNSFFRPEAKQNQQRVYGTHEGSERTTGSGHVHKHPFYTCHAWVRFNITTLWSWKKESFLEI